MATQTPVKSQASAEHLQRFEQKINAVRQAAASLPGDDFYDLLWKIIHRPGWTTHAEGLFFEAAVESIITQTQLLAQAHRQVLAAAEQVGADVSR